jgi:hypothetical protein
VGARGDYRRVRRARELQRELSPNSSAPAATSGWGRPAHWRSRGRSACGGPASCARRSCSTRSPVRASLDRNAPAHEPRLGAGRGVAAARGGEAAGDVRRWHDSCEHLAVVCAAPDPTPVLARFAALPQIVAVVEQAERRAVGVPLEDVPSSSSPPSRSDSGAPSCGRRVVGVRGGARAATDAFDERFVYSALGLLGARRNCARRRFAASRRRLSSRRPTSAATSVATRRGRTDARASTYIAICDHTLAGTTAFRASRSSRAPNRDQRSPRRLLDRGGAAGAKERGVSVSAAVAGVHHA